jgi:hydroxymethylglutaryl-CoA lyase
VKLIEVGLRDGIQSEPRFIPTERKVALAHAIARAGVPMLEATAFVHPRVVPQMADAEAVTARENRAPGIAYAALVPNRRGAERALAAGVDEIRCVIMCSETFNHRNVQMPVSESLRQAAEMARLAHEAGVRFVGGLGTAFGCPFEGAVDEKRVRSLVAALVALGVDGVCLSDTTGMANPAQVERLAGLLLDQWPELPVILHFHNTRGAGLANVLGGMAAGVTCFEASVGGIGGCPFAPKATGNICTEDTVHMLHEMGVETGIDLAALLDAARLMEETLGRELPGQVLKAGPRSRLFPAT